MQISSASIYAWIVVGASLFLLALALSALAVPQLWLLHLLQAAIYIAVLVFARRSNPYGLGAGIAISIVWTGLEWAAGIPQAGVALWWSLARNRQVDHLETMMVPVGCLGHAILLASCLLALRSQGAAHKVLWKSVGGGALALTYFAAIIWLTAPR